MMREKTGTSRRDFLKLSGVVSLGFLGLQHFVANPLLAAVRAAEDFDIGYGPLLPDPLGVLNLPKGFSYKIISRQGNKMSDGLLVPGAPDGMATFAGPKGRTILVRNHELSGGTNGAFGPKNELLGQVDKEKFFDFGKGKHPQLGGTTTVVYNPATGEVEKEFLSLVGTTRNCAGGPTPWNTWITCEESVLQPEETNSCEQSHGYNFEVPASTKIKLTKAEPIKAMGRMNHEAVAVDPRTGIVYMTEDTSDSLIYRFIPRRKGKLLKGGQLQALVIREQKSQDTRNWAKLTTPALPVGQAFAVEWIDIDNVESPANDLRLQGYNKGAARFARGEGMWFGNNEVYFACTNGGKLGYGQVFRYVPSPHEGQPEEKQVPGQLTLFVESNDSKVANACDNMTVAPWGDLILCEDNPSPSLVGITPEGRFYKLGQNIGFKSEFAGGVFSPGGETYFVNLQGAGLTVAITGPWRKTMAMR
ncbi:MAG: alkaline phosphatase PhoX [Adhaeribacter sp.]